MTESRTRIYMLSVLMNRPNGRRDVHIKKNHAKKKKSHSVIT